MGFARGKTKIRWSVAKTYRAGTPTVFGGKDGNMTGTMKMSLALAVLAGIATPVWSQERDSNLEEKARQTLESGRETAGAVAESVD